MQKVVKKTKEIEETEYYCDICGKQFQHSVCFYSLHQCVICHKEVCSDCAVDNPMWDDYDNKQIICKYCYEIYKPFKDKLNELYKVYEIEKEKIWKELRKKSEEKYAEHKR